MKKIGLLLILLIFAICAIIGFQAASRYYSIHLAPTQPSSSAANTLQQKIILLHVDSLKTPTPVLESVWGLFMYISKTPSLIFVPLFQPETGTGADLPVLQFTLDSNGTVPEEFLHTLQDHFNFNASGYVILDDQAVTAFQNQILSQNQSGAEVILSERETLDRLCSVLQDPQARKKVQLPWTEIVPDHFHTDMSLDDLKGNWLRLARADRPPDCKILPGD